MEKTKLRLYETAILKHGEETEIVFDPAFILAKDVEQAKSKTLFLAYECKCITEKDIDDIEILVRNF